MITKKVISALCVGLGLINSVSFGCSHTFFAPDEKNEKTEQKKEIIKPKRKQDVCIKVKKNDGQMHVIIIMPSKNNSKTITISTSPISPANNE